MDAGGDGRVGAGCRNGHVPPCATHAQGDGSRKHASYLRFSVTPVGLLIRFHRSTDRYVLNDLNIKTTKAIFHTSKICLFPSFTTCFYILHHSAFRFRFAFFLSQSSQNFFFLFKFTFCCRPTKPN